MIYAHTATVATAALADAASYAATTAANMQQSCASAALDAAIAVGRASLYGAAPDLLTVELASAAARELAELIRGTTDLAEYAKTTEAAEQVATARLEIWFALEALSQVWEHTPAPTVASLELLSEQLEGLEAVLERLDEALWADRLELARLAGDGVATVTLPMWQVLKIATRLVYARPCGG